MICLDFLRVPGEGTRTLKTLRSIVFETIVCAHIASAKGGTRTLMTG